MNQSDLEKYTVDRDVESAYLYQLNESVVSNKTKPRLPHSPREHVFCDTWSPSKPALTIRVLHYPLENVERGKHRGIPGLDWDHGSCPPANSILRIWQTDEVVTAVAAGFELTDLHDIIQHHLDVRHNTIFSIRKDAGKARTAEDMRKAILDGKMVYNLGQPVFSEQMHPEDRFISDGEIYARASNQEGKEDIISAFAQALLDEPDLLNSPVKDEVTGSVVQAQDAIAKLAKKNPAFKLKRKKK